MRPPRNIMDLLFKTKRAIEEGELIGAGDRLLAAVSGGIDSIVMANILLELRDEIGFRLEVIHINHKLRGTDSDGDEISVAEFCRKAGIEIHTLNWQGPQKGENLQESARDFRYASFLETAKKIGANKIALAHNLDDQAETVLLNLIRGAGLDGLTGMRSVVCHPFGSRRPVAAGFSLRKLRTLKGAATMPAQITHPGSRRLQPAQITHPKGCGYRFESGDDIYIIRPLLGISRAEVEAFAKEKGLFFRKDRSNDETKYSRNFIRLKIMPLIREINPDASGTLAATADLLRKDEAFIHAAAETAFKRIVTEENKRCIAFDQPQFEALGPSIRARILKSAYIKLTGSVAGIAKDHILKMDDISTGNKKNGRYSLPNSLGFERKGGKLAIFKE